MPPSNEKYNPVCVTLDHEEDGPIPQNVVAGCAFLYSVGRHVLDVVFGPAASDMTVDPSIGLQFQDIEPDENGELTFDLASSLPAYLPRLRDQPDYALDVDGVPLTVSLRMLRCFTRHGDIADHRGLTYFLVHRHNARSPELTHRMQVDLAHPIPIQIFVSARFKVKATDANDAVVRNLYDWQRQFAKSVSRLIECIRSVDHWSGRMHHTTISPQMFSIYWLAVHGKNPDKIRSAQLTGDFDLAAHRGLNDFDDSMSQRLEHALNDPLLPESHETALALARALLHQGNLGFALVQSSIACEAVLSRHYREYLLSRNVSKSKIDDAWRDTARYSQLLNIHLRVMCDLNLLSKADQIISMVDQARKHRNDVVHEGRIAKSVSRAQASDMIDATEAMIDFVLSVRRTQVDLQGTTP